jgi:hypothetical protein
MFCGEVSLWRLRVLADADPCALARVFERFLNLNVLPRRIVAECGTNAIVHVQVDVCGLQESQVRTITAKIGQSPGIVNAYFHRL